MKEAGIDLRIFQTHSTRSALVSKALEKRISLNTIMDSIGWTNAGTIQKYYNKTIDTQQRLDLQDIL